MKRQCHYCHQEKAAIGFKGRRCKDCESKRQKEYREKNAEKLKQKRKEKYWADPEHAKREALMWYYENEEIAKKRNRDYWHATKEERNAQQREKYRAEGWKQKTYEHIKRLSNPEYRKKANIRAKEWYRKNKDRRREYEKEYAKRPERIKKNKCRRETKNAILNGRIKVETTCLLCGCGETKLEVHHLNYDDPYDVVWLCKACHRKWHTTEKLKNLIGESDATTQKKP